MFKNVAGQKLLVLAFRTTNSKYALGDAANISCKVSLDSGPLVDLTDVNPVETEDGRYLFDLTQAETNGNTIDFYPESSTADVQVIAINHDRQSVVSTADPDPTPVASGVRGGYFGSGYFGAPSVIESYQLVGNLGGELSGVITLSDIVERVGERVGGFDGDTRTIRMVRRAAKDALRGLPTKSDWKYYIRDLMISVSAPVDLTVTYVQSTRTATVTDGTIPADAEFGELSIEGVQYNIASVSGSSIVLDYGSNPGEDFTGEATWVRSTYRIPKATKIYGLWRVRGSCQIEQITPQQFSARKVIANYIGTPVFFTVGAESVLGANDLMLSPAPSVSEQYKVSATFAPIMPSVFQEFGEATGASGATTVTIPEATSGWLGCILRVAVGSSDKQSDLRYEEHTWQALVTGVSGTTVTLSEAIPSTFTAETVLVSSVVDIDIESMQTYYESLVYSYYCRNSHNEHLEEAEALASRLYMGARNADAKMDRSTSHLGFGWPYGVFPDTRFYSSRD